MEDRIEVGEYVRVNNDNRNYIGIGKAIRLVNESVYVNMNNKYNLSVCFQINNIVKHSKQLIDLIENKDVLKVRIDKTIMVFGMDEDTSDIKYKELIENIENGEYELLEILTHEQFEANCFKVGGLYGRNQ